MSYNFDLTKVSAIDDNRQQDVYRFNLALNHALLTGDSAVVRRFYQFNASKLGTRDISKYHEIDRSFFKNSPPNNAFTYAGVIPWICESIVRLVASSGFKVSSPLKNQVTNMEGIDADSLQKDIDEYAQHVCDEIKLQELFERGVYLEAGLGDLLYRISYDSDISDNPIVDVVEPQNFELKYKRGHIYEVVIKDSSAEITFEGTKIKNKRIIEMRETYTKDLGNTTDPLITIGYSFWENKREIKQDNPIYTSCTKHWGIQYTTITLPFKDFPLVYKQNSKPSVVYKRERGVPDIHGLDTIEDSLSESLSQLIDTLRTASPKTIVDERMLSSDEKGNTLQFNEFDKRYIVLKDTEGLTGLLTTVQARIEYQSFIETFRALVSHACNKAGLSPTTLGVTGLESINSAVESQDAREKPSLRTREIKHTSWKPCLEQVLNKYLQYVAYLQDEPIADYTDILDITFNDYINPSTESVLSVIGQAVASRVYSVEIAVEKVFEQEGRDYTLDDIIAEAARIKGITPQQEMEILGLIPQQDNLEDNQSTKTINEYKGDKENDKSADRASNRGSEQAGDNSDKD